LRAQRSNPVNQTTGAADAAIQMPLSKMPLIKCLIDPLDRRATLAMTATPAFLICWIAALRSR